LAQNGKVISVRLSLFADMIKGNWDDVVEQVGALSLVLFLEETFSAATAPQGIATIRRRLSGVGAAPDSGTEIKAD
jgi:hypothetical protein